MPIDPSQGFASGLISGQMAQQESQLNDILIQEGPIKLESEKVALEGAKLMLQKQKTFAQLLMNMNAGGGAPGNSPQDQAKILSDNLFNMSQAALKSGLPEEAESLMKTGDSIRKNAFEIQKGQMDMQLRSAQVVASLIKDVAPGDTAEFHRRLMIYQGMEGMPPMKPEIMQQPFTKELKDTLLSRATTVQQQSTQRLQEAHTKEAEANARLEPDRRRLMNAQADAAEALRQQRIKAGAADKAPSAQELQTITDQAHGDMPDADIQDLRARSRIHAITWMRELMAKGFSREDAAKTAYQDAVNAGDFGGIRRGTQMAGSSPEKPLPIPMTKDKSGKDVLDTTKVKKNQWYRDKKLFGDDKPRLLVAEDFWTQEELDKESEAISSGFNDLTEEEREEDRANADTAK